MVWWRCSIHCILILQSIPKWHAHKRFMGYRYRGNCTRGVFFLTFFISLFKLMCNVIIVFTYSNFAVFSHLHTGSSSPASDVVVTRLLIVHLRMSFSADKASWSFATPSVARLLRHSHQNSVSTWVPLYWTCLTPLIHGHSLSTPQGKNFTWQWRIIGTWEWKHTE